MLLWSPASETTHALPHSVLLRTKLSLLLEMTCHVEEIVASNLTGQGRQRQRDQHVQLMSERRVVEKMRKSGVTMPPGRETELYKQVVEEDDDDEHHASGTLIRTRAWHKELEDLRQRFADGQFTKAEGLPQGYRGKIPKGATVTPEFDRLSQLEANLTHVRKRTGMTDQLLQEQAEIDALDARAYNCSPSDPQHHAILKELDERKELLHKHMDDFRNLHIRNEFEHFNHDRKAFSQTPPLLLWDRREADPLKAYDEEFVPESGLCLLDIQPKHPQPCTMTPAEFDLFFPFVSTWWLSGRENLTTLEQIAPGAIDALVPQVPALTDPRRGGERDIRDLPLYRLTPEMACGIMKAWVNWPFKRDLVDVLRISGDSKDKESDNPLSAHPRF